MAKLDVAVSEGDDWLRDQRREEKSYSLRMAFDNTLSSITVEHHQACDAQTVREMHHNDCDARSAAEFSRSGTSSKDRAQEEARQNQKKQGIKFIIAGIVAIVVPAIAINGADLDIPALYMVCVVGFILLFVGIVKIKIATSKE